MERLTYMHKENVYKPNGELAHIWDRGWWLNGLDWYKICENACPLYDEDAEDSPDCNADCPLRLAFAKLAAYEDTGLTPEEVSELAAAKRDGRLVVLPCKVGDTVYRVDTDQV